MQIATKLGQAMIAGAPLSVLGDALGQDRRIVDFVSGLKPYSSGELADISIERRLQAM